jgi:hypothetical protein
MHLSIVLEFSAVYPLVDGPERKKSHFDKTWPAVHIANFH